MPIRTADRPRRAAVALAAAIAAAALLPAAAPAATGEAIVFERVGSIVTVAPGGGSVLTIGAGYNPAVSPDGSRIAFEHRSNVWTMKRDGTNRREVIPGARTNADPAWSPDGTQIAFTSRASGNLDIWSVPAAGGLPRNLTANPANDEQNPAWSPDGGQIAYDRVGCEPLRPAAFCIYVMNPDGGARVNLTTEGAIPGCESQPNFTMYGRSRDAAWSPDGTRIAFTGPTHCTTGGSGTDIWIMDRNGANKRDLTPDAQTSDAQPTFSPDGTRIAWVRKGSAVFTMAVSGTLRQQITTGSDYYPHWAPPSA